MDRFLARITLFFLPISILIIFIVWIDFFKILGFQDYYSEQKIVLNREVVTTSTYNYYRETEKFDSFIFGSSRSQAFKCKNWLKHIDSDAKPFHFDSSGEGIWGISKKFEYIDGLGDSIKNVIIILDREALTKISFRKEHLYIPMPCVSGISKKDYYFTFLKASLDPVLLLAYIDLSITGKWKSYMKSRLKNPKYKHKANPLNCDLWYGYDEEIKSDSVNYYRRLMSRGVFYNRKENQKEPCEVTIKEKSQLLIINEILERHKTNYKIVISPLYDQFPLEKEQLNLLYNIFDKKNIYNFSGKNEFTNSITNYYESSHYKTSVANQIMNIIYK